jgi:poly(3-hydroxybutyrate) depolymerase
VARADPFQSSNIEAHAAVWRQQAQAPIRGTAARKWLSAAVLGVLLAAWRPALAGESVSFPSLDGALTGGKATVLRGLLMKPEGIGPFPAIVALHGCNGLFKEGALVAREAAWAQLLTAHGYVVLFPDSLGPRDVATDCEGRVRAWAERSYDANVHLFLHVKVRENWLDDPERYRATGLEFPKG